MKGILTILVLLLALAGVSAPAALAGDAPDDALRVPGIEKSGDLIRSDSGMPPDDDGEGDPGDAGDGYGYDDPASKLLGSSGVGSDIDAMWANLVQFMMEQLALLP